MGELAGINHLKAVRAFEKAGFWIGRQGKHLIMHNGSRTLVIPRHNPIKSFTRIGIVKSAASLSSSSASYSDWILWTLAALAALR